MIALFIVICHFFGSIFANIHHGRSFAQSNFETAVRFYDKDLFHASLNSADQLNIHVRGFYHVTEDLNHWKEILEEHLMIMDGKRFQSNLFARSPSKNGINMKHKTNKISTGWSSVFDIIDKVQITFEGSSNAYSNLTNLFSSMHIRSGSEKIEVHHYDNALLTNNKFVQLSEKDKHVLSEIVGEVHTLNQLHKYCSDRTAKKEHAFVFYLHNHETHCTNGDTPAKTSSSNDVDSSFVHDVVNSFIVEFPGVCLGALLHGGYSSCGVDFEKGRYAHNVWWAQCDHVAARGAISTDKILAAFDSSTTATIAAVLQKQSDLVHDFIFRASDESSSTAGLNSDRIQQGDRCAFNFNSGGKEIDNHVDGVVSTSATSKQQQVSTTRRHISEDQCSRTGYRFGLIEVLSRLHDDGVLLNDRHGLSSMQTEARVVTSSGNATQHAHKMCV